MTRNPPTVARVGARASALARSQAGAVVEALSARFPDVRFELVSVSTAGDRERSLPLAKLGVGVFVRALERALADRRVDIAVHSLKDMPAADPAGFEIAAVTEREDPRDVLVNRWGVTFDRLPPGARIGTGSPRRRAQVLAARPDLVVAPMRGNVDTRLAKARAGGDGGYDGAILAAAGLARLGRLDEADDFLDPARFVPAVGQGALGVEIRSGDSRIRVFAASVDHRETRLAATAERAFLAAMGGGCSVPLTAHARLEGSRLVVSGFASDPDARRVVRAARVGSPAAAREVGAALAAHMLQAGAPVETRE